MPSAGQGTAGGSAIDALLGPGRGRYLLSVGTLEPRKNHGLLLDAFDQLAVGKLSGAVGNFAHIPPGVEERVLREPELVKQLLSYLTVQVSEMFRDPSYFRAIREKVVPHLRTYPSLKVWIAGCSSGEELHSFAILFREEGLLDRTLFYATDINDDTGAVLSAISRAMARAAGSNASGEWTARSRESCSWMNLPPAFSPARPTKRSRIA